MNRDDRLLFLLAAADQAVKKHANKTLAAEGVRITIAQSGILFLLKQRDRRMISELGNNLRIENSAMTGLVDRLEKSSFVKRVADPADRRASLICATPAGLDEVGKAKCSSAVTGRRMLLKPIYATLVWLTSNPNFGKRITTW